MLTLILMSTLAQAAVETPPRLPIDFPQYDAAAWELERTGLIARAAKRRLREAPDSVDTLDLLIKAHRTEDALRVLRRIVEKHPEDMARAFEAVSQDSFSFHDQAREYSGTLHELIDAARGRFSTMTAEQAARTERQLLMVDGRPLPGNSFTERLKQFVTEYQGTETALLTEVDIILFSGTSARQLQLLEDFERDHPGSVVGAKALYTRGSQLAGNVASSGMEPPGADPTARFMQILDIVDDLKSGRFPSCEWVDRAPSLVNHFYASNPSYAPGNVARMLGAYYRIARTYFAVVDASPLNEGTGGILAQRMAKLFELQGEGFLGAERTVRDLEREVANTGGALYLRALLYMARLNSRALFYLGERSTIDQAERNRVFQNAVDALELLARGQSRHTRKALATLATLYFEQRDYSSARDRYRALRWDADALVVTWRVQGSETAMTISFRYELEDGGRRLRAAEQIRGGGRDQDNQWVFERPGGPSELRFRS